MSFFCCWLLGLLSLHFLCYGNLWQELFPAWLILLLRHTVAKTLSDTIPQGSRELNSPAFDLSFLLCFCPDKSQSLSSWGHGGPFSLSHPWITGFLFSFVCGSPCFVCWPWPKVPQVYWNYRGHICLPKSSAPFHWANQLELFLVYLCELRGRSPRRICPMGFLPPPTRL